MVEVDLVIDTPSERCNRHDARHSRRLDCPTPSPHPAVDRVAETPARHAARAGRGPAGLVALSRSEEHTLNSSHSQISYAVFCLKKKKNIKTNKTITVNYATYLS